MRKPVGMKGGGRLKDEKVVGPKLGQRRRRRASFSPTTDQRLSPPWNRNGEAEEPVRVTGGPRPGIQPCDMLLGSGV